MTDTTALALAIRFHETYERLAPSFGYETRTDTRQFDPESKNGRLMVAVCGELAGLVPISPPAADQASNASMDVAWAEYVHQHGPVEHDPKGERNAMEFGHRYATQRCACGHSIDSHFEGGKCDGPNRNEDDPHSADCNCAQYTPIDAQAAEREADQQAMAIGSAISRAAKEALRVVTAERDTAIQRAEAAERGRDEAKQMQAHMQGFIDRLASDREGLMKALKALSFAAQISGGVAGRDDGLVAAIDEAARVLKEVQECRESSATPPAAPSELTEAVHRLFASYDSDSKTVSPESIRSLHAALSSAEQVRSAPSELAREPTAWQVNHAYLDWRAGIEDDLVGDRAGFEAGYRAAALTRREPEGLSEPSPVLAILTQAKEAVYEYHGLPHVWKVSVTFFASKPAEDLTHELTQIINAEHLSAQPGQTTVTTTATEDRT